MIEGVDVVVYDEIYEISLHLDNEIDITDDIVSDRVIILYSRIPSINHTVFCDENISLATNVTRKIAPSITYENNILTVIARVINSLDK